MNEKLYFLLFNRVHIYCKWGEKVKTHAHAHAQLIRMESLQNIVYLRTFKYRCSTSISHIFLKPYCFAKIRTGFISLLLLFSISLFYFMFFFQKKSIELTYKHFNSFFSILNRKPETI